MLIIHGERDVIVPLEQARALAAALPHATLSVIAGAGHVPTVTRPAEIAEGMHRFLDAILGGAG